MRNISSTVCMFNVGLQFILLLDLLTSWFIFFSVALSRTLFIFSCVAFVALTAVAMSVAAVVVRNALVFIFEMKGG